MKVAMKCNNDIYIIHVDCPVDNKEVVEIEGAARLIEMFPNLEDEDIKLMEVL